MGVVCSVRRALIKEEGDFREFLSDCEPGLGQLASVVSNPLCYTRYQRGSEDRLPNTYLHYKEILGVVTYFIKTFY